MLRTYEAILVGDRLEFTGDGPQASGPLSVHVTVIGTAGAPEANGDGGRGQTMAAALERLASGGSFAEIPDPVAWQRETRQDRDLPRPPETSPAPPDAP